MSLLELIFPKQCVWCGKVWEYLCSDCKRQLQPHMEICSWCHRYSKDYQTCLDCKSQKNFVLDGLLIPFSYSWLLKKIILKLKYYHRRSVVDFLIDRVCLAVYSNMTLSKKIEEWRVLISGIPSHWYRRYFVKWYNQSYLLAKNLWEKLWVQYVEILKKNKSTKSQASLDREWRLKNLKNAFSLCDPNYILSHIDTVILVDDVTTTGSTMNEVAKLIKFYYPNISVWWVVLARKDR
jgi:ComF family protein